MVFEKWRGLCQRAFVDGGLQKNVLRWRFSKGEEIGGEVIPRNKGITWCQGLCFPSLLAESYPLASKLSFVLGLEVGCCQKTMKQSSIHAISFSCNCCLNSMTSENSNWVHSVHGNITSDGTNTNAAMFGSTVIMRDSGVILVFRQGRRMKYERSSVQIKTNFHLPSDSNYGSC